MIDKRVLDYTNLTDKDAFYLWMNECPVKEEFTDAFEDENDRCEFYFFRIPKTMLFYSFQSFQFHSVIVLLSFPPR